MTDDRPALQAAAGTGQMLVSDVPFIPQKGARCGPAAMTSLLKWSGVNITPDRLEGRFYGELAEPRATLSETANDYGRVAYPVVGIDNLTSELAAGHPVLLLQNRGVAAKPLWDCSVAVGYRDGGGILLINAGDTSAKPVARETLERLWAETGYWGMIVLKPGELPAFAEESILVKAADNLARANHYWDAVLAYDSVLSRWPRSADALMGLGSSLYMLGDTEGAADSYRAAAMVASDPAPARAALEYVLADMGKSGKAPQTAPWRTGKPPVPLVQDISAAQLSP